MITMDRPHAREGIKLDLRTVSRNYRRQATVNCRLRRRIFTNIPHAGTPFVFSKNWWGTSKLGRRASAQLEYTTHAPFFFFDFAELPAVVQPSLLMVRLFLFLDHNLLNF